MRVDLHFSSGLDSSQSFIADIATVTDVGYETKNPLEAFKGELLRIVKKRNLHANRFSLDVDGEIKGRLGKGKMKLSLPSRGEFEKVFSKRGEP